MKKKTKCCRCGDTNYIPQDWYVWREPDRLYALCEECYYLSIEIEKIKKCTLDEEE